MSEEQATLFAFNDQAIQQMIEQLVKIQHPTAQYSDNQLQMANRVIVEQIRSSIRVLKVLSVQPEIANWVKKLTDAHKIKFSLL